MDGPGRPDVLAALLARQRAAFLLAPRVGVELRRDRLRRLESLIDTHAARFAAAIDADFGGRSRHETTLAETHLLLGAARHARRRVARWMRPQRVPTGLLQWPGRSRIVLQPLGVVGIIGAWNYPLLLTLGPLVGVLAAGNRALVKPAEGAPRTAEALAAAIAATFDVEEVATVTGDAQLGAAFAALPFDHLVFTGSTAVGRLVAAAAAPNLTPLTLELGGKSPAIVDASADLERAAERIAWGKLLNAGQTCIAPDYVLVAREHCEDFATLLANAMCRLYPGAARNPDYTSIVSARHRERLLALADEARAAGARVVEVMPGEATSRRLGPMLVLDAPDSARLMREEIFGPVLPIVPVESLDAAIGYVNARPRPLALYWFGRDAAAQARILGETFAGGVTINDTLLHITQDALPFGGIGPSGCGHYHGEHGFRRFSATKAVFEQSRLGATRLVYPPYRAWLEGVMAMLRRLS